VANARISYTPGGAIERLLAAVRRASYGQVLFWDDDLEGFRILREDSPRDVPEQNIIGVYRKTVMTDKGRVPLPAEWVREDMAAWMESR